MLYIAGAASVKKARCNPAQVADLQALETRIHSKLDELGVAKVRQATCVMLSEKDPAPMSLHVPFSVLVRLSKKTASFLIPFPSSVPPLLLQRPMLQLNEWTVLFKFQSGIAEEQNKRKVAELAQKRNDMRQSLAQQVGFALPQAK